VVSFPNSDFGENSSLPPAMLGEMTATVLHGPDSQSSSNFSNPNTH